MKHPETKETRSMFRIRLPLSFLLAFSLSGCDSSNGNPAEQDPPPAKSEASQHAAAGVRAGSHEDWCGEHQVPESMCTRCNPELGAAFKATGDWCPEHGLPESQCLACNPHLKIERPPKEDEGK